MAVVRTTPGVKEFQVNAKTVTEGVKKDIPMKR